MRRLLLLPLFAALLAGCGDDELAPVEAPGPDLTTVEGAVTALEEAYSYQKAGDALDLYAASYVFTPALPESVPFFEPSETAWALDVETDVVEYMLTPERVNWLDQVYLEISIITITPMPNGTKVVDADVELSLLEGSTNYIRGFAPMQLVYEVDGEGKHRLAAWSESIPAEYDPLNDILVSAQKVRVLPANYVPPSP
jgi:hypothetical protein